MRWIPLIALFLSATGCGGSEGPGSNVLGSQPVTLEQVQSAVFTPSCAIGGCHLGGAAPFGLDLSAGQAFGNLVGVNSSEQPQFQRIKRFDPADSYVFMKVSADPRITGDPMPFQGTPLSSQRLALLENWIEQGANP